MNWRVATIRSAEFRVQSRGWSVRIAGQLVGVVPRLCSLRSVGRFRRVESASLRHMESTIVLPLSTLHSSIACYSPGIREPSSPARTSMNT